MINKANKNLTTVKIFYNISAEFGAPEENVPKRWKLNRGGSKKKLN